MALIWVFTPSHFLLQKTHNSLRFPYSFSPSPRIPTVRATTGTEGSSRVSGAHEDPTLLRKPLVTCPQPSGETPSRDGGEEVEEWVDWEDRILEDTVPLVGFVRMILHSGKYDNGDKLTPEHEKIILERLLPYHPESQKKIGCGVDYITVDFHPEFDNSRCLFIVRKNGEVVDFSYWKCIKGLIKKNYPLYADSFILRHFRRRKQME